MVRSFYSSSSFTGIWKSLLFPWLVALLLVSQDTKADAITVVHKDFESLRLEVLEVIKGARERIWLASDFLSDGSIVTALFLAKRKNVDVQVLLGRAKARAYMSRLNYLKNQKIPVFLKPNPFPVEYASSVLVDRVLILSDSNLDFLAKKPEYNVAYGNAEEVSTYMEIFAEAVGAKIPAVPLNRPKVGRSGGGRTYTSTAPQRKGALSVPEPKYTRSKNDTYIYSRTGESAPQGVSTSLPKTTIWEKQMRQNSPNDADLNVDAGGEE